MRPLHRHLTLLHALVLGAAGLAFHAEPSPKAAAGLSSQESRPAHQLETWELAAASKKARHSSNSSGEQQGDDEPDELVMDLVDPGMCYLEPLERTVLANWDKVLADVERGKEVAANSKVIFAGLIRNAEAAVQSSYDMLTRIGRHFKDYQMVVLENDSGDNTAPRLRYIARHDNRVKFVSKSMGMNDTRGQERDRMQRMATLRNMLHDEVRDFVRVSPGWDFIIMYDYDLNLFGGNVVTTAGVIGALGRTMAPEDQWDMICANSLRHLNGDPDERIGYHDCFAFRPVDNTYYDQWTCGGTMGRRLIKDYEMMKVDSCFGGLAMYKAHAFLTCRYDPNVYDCEHVPFHQCIREHSGGQSRIFMDPMLTTLYDSDIPLRCRKVRNEEMQDPSYYSA